MCVGTNTADTLSDLFLLHMITIIFISNTKYFIILFTIYTFYCSSLVILLSNVINHIKRALSVQILYGATVTFSVFIRTINSSLFLLSLTWAQMQDHTFVRLRLMMQLCWHTHTGGRHQLLPTWSDLHHSLLVHHISFVSSPSLLSQIYLFVPLYISCEIRRERY